MSISYPLSLPTAGKVRTSRLVAINRNTATVSPFTGQAQVAALQAAWWELDYTFAPMKRETAEVWISFLLSLRGRYGTFLAGDPDGAAPQGIATGNPPKLLAAATPGARTLSTKLWAPSREGILKAGDYVQVDTRLYKVLQDVASDSSGHATLDVFPPVREAHVINSPLVLDDAVGLFRLASDELAWTADDLQHYGLSFSAIEAL